MPNSLQTAAQQSTARKVLRYALQVVAYGAFAAFIGYFSTSPPYRLRGEGNAIVKLSFSHSAQLAHPCRTRTDAELAKLAPNMRTRMDCRRERAPVIVELDMDGNALYRITTQPTGLHQDGSATVYRRWKYQRDTMCSMPAWQMDRMDLFNTVVTLISNWCLVRFSSLIFWPVMAALCLLAVSLIGKHTKPCKA